MAKIKYKEIYDQIKDYDIDQLRGVIEVEYFEYRKISPLLSEYRYKWPLELIFEHILKVIDNKHEQLKQYFESNPDRTKFTLYLIEIVAPIVLLEDKDFTTKLVIACILSVCRMGIDDILKK